MVRFADGRGWRDCVAILGWRRFASGSTCRNVGARRTQPKNRTRHDGRQSSQNCLTWDHKRLIVSGYGNIPERAVPGVGFLPCRIQSGVSSELAGTLRDTSGAVLPRVTVEASSPALIEESNGGHG